MAKYLTLALLISVLLLVNVTSVALKHSHKHAHRNLKHFEEQPVDEEPIPIYDTIVGGWSYHSGDDESEH